MKLEVNALDQLNARESTGDKSASGFSFKSDWLNKWCDFFNPITELIKANLPACFRHLIGCIYSTIIDHFRTGSAQKRLTIKKGRGFLGFSVLLPNKQNALSRLDI